MAIAVIVLVLVVAVAGAGLYGVRKVEAGRRELLKEAQERQLRLDEENQYWRQRVSDTFAILGDMGIDADKVSFPEWNSHPNVFEVDWPAGTSEPAGFSKLFGRFVASYSCDPFKGMKALLKGEGVPVQFYSVTLTEVGSRNPVEPPEWLDLWKHPTGENVARHLRCWEEFVVIVGEENLAREMVNSLWRDRGIGSRMEVCQYRNYLLDRAWAARILAERGFR